MSVFATITAGLTKAENFLITIFTKTAEIDKTFVALAPATKAAILATFYDVSKAVASGVGVSGVAASGNIPGAVMLSSQTLSLVQGVMADLKNDASVIAADVKALGIAASTPAAAGQAPTA